MPIPPRLCCRVEVLGIGVHLIVSGALDDCTSDDFDLAVRAVLSGCPDVLVLDLSAVDSISAEATTTLVDAVCRAADVGASVVIVPSLPVRQRLQQLALDRTVALSDTNDFTT
jgi:anti-anti-sigma regulatory factor